MDRDAALKTAQVAGAVAQSKPVRNLILGLVVLALLAGCGHFTMGAMSTAQMMGMRIQAPDSGAASLSCQVPLAAGAGSSTSVSLGSLTAAQIEGAHIIWGTAHELGFGDEGALVALVTYAQESTWGADKKTHRPDSNVDVGPFQQRALPGWYASGKTVEDNVKILSDTAYAARTFFTGYKVTAADVAAARANGTQAAGPVGYITPGLAQVKGWRDDMTPTEAAQAVQRSAFPSAYAKHEATARNLIARFNAEGAPAVASAGEAVNPALCDPPGAASAEVASCPDSGLAAEKGLTPDATRVLRCAYAQWPKLEYGGVRPDSMEYHPSGRAIDIMVPGSCVPLGQAIAEWARANAAQLGVVDVIWCQKIWSVRRSAEGWRAMTDRGSPTANHRDHVHVTVDGNSAGTDAVPVAAPTGVGVSEGQGDSSTRLPVDDYKLTARFGQAGSAWSRNHTGLDFAAAAGQPVRAIRAGTVRAVEWNAAYGNLTKIEHAGGIESWYAHQQDTSVAAGAKVSAGQQIGSVGWTGNVKPAGPGGAHLHLEVREGGSPIDPDQFLKSAGVDPEAVS